MPEEPPLRRQWNEREQEGLLGKIVRFVRDYPGRFAVMVMIWALAIVGIILKVT